MNQQCGLHSVYWWGQCESCILSFPFIECFGCTHACPESWLPKQGTQQLPLQGRGAQSSHSGCAVHVFPACYTPLGITAFNIPSFRL